MLDFGGSLESSCKLIGFLVSAVILTGCTSGPEAHEIVDRSVNAHGLSSLADAEMSFLFRERSFSAWRNDGLFRYSRTYTDSLGRIVDESMDNDSIYRSIDGEIQILDAAEKRKIEVAINSVIYFASLPFPLWDPGVLLQKLEDEQIADQLYHRIEVTFTEEGGGEEFRDRFIYWVNADNYLIDFMSYYYFTDGGGSRFRVATDRLRPAGAIIINNYDNYSTVSRNLTIDEIEDYAALYQLDSLRLVSQINLDQLQVSHFQ